LCLDNIHHPVCEMLHGAGAGSSAGGHVLAGRKATEASCGGGRCAAAVFAIHGGMPALVYGPVAENVHALDERVSLPSLSRVTKTIALFAAGWCGADVAV
jgi:acetylornithine deacetylase/succinyl-diaminopimelate desuccinylase-like protein